MTVRDLDSYQEQLPSSADLLALASRSGVDGELSSLRLILQLMHFARSAQSALFDDMQNTYGISRGRFVLLVSLRENGELTVNDLAARLGVSAASTSVMIKRMLAEEEPLIVRSVNPLARHSFNIRLSARGEALVDNLVAKHLKTVTKILLRMTELPQDHPFSFRELSDLVSGTLLQIEHALALLAQRLAWNKQ